jgi:tRNA-modifying protein YgfZ
MSIGDQYRIIETRAGWIDRGDRGRIRLDGRDSPAFLQALLSNDVQALQAGEGVYATYLTPQGRMLADLRVYHRGDHLIAAVARGIAAGLVGRLDGLIFAEDVRVTDVSATLGQIAVTGGRAAEIVARALSLDPAALAVLAPLAQTGVGAGFVARGDEAALSSFEIFVPAADAAGLITHLEGAGAAGMSEELAEALRIDAARPAFRVDMTSDTIPLEAGLLDRGISTSKGCYVGQEVIVRVLHRGGGRVAKHLVKLSLGEGAEVSPGDAVLADGRDVGRVTSAAASPTGSGTIALAYVHRDEAKIGRQLTVGESKAPARIEALAS